MASSGWIYVDCPECGAENEVEIGSAEWCCACGEPLTEEAEVQVRSDA